MESEGYRDILSKSNLDVVIDDVKTGGMCSVKDDCVFCWQNWMLVGIFTEVEFKEGGDVFLTGYVCSVYREVFGGIDSRVWSLGEAVQGDINV